MNEKNKEKHFTVIVAPHDEDGSFSIRIPLWLCQLTCLLLLIFFFGLLSLLYQYRELSAVDRDNSYLKEIHRAQQNKIDEIEHETAQLFNKMHEIEGMTEKVAENLGLEPPQEEK